MSVHKLKDGRWYAEYRTPEDKSKYRREYFGRGPEAERKAREYFDSLGLRGYVKRTPDPDRSPLFKELAQGYLASRMASLEDSTYQVMVYKLEAFILPFFGGMEALKITKEHLDRYVINRLALGRQASTVAREVTDIQIIMNWGVGRNLIRFNPLHSYKKPRPNSPIIQPPSMQEMLDIDKHSAEHLRRYLKIIYYTGARPATETFSLKYSSVLWDLGLIRVISVKKGGRLFRDIPFGEEFKKLLLEWYDKDKRNDNMFIVNFRGKPIINIYTAWRRAKKKAGIKRRLTPYSYRHAFASIMLSQGADLKVVSEIMGHSTPALTLQIYQHTNKLMHRNAIEKLPKMNWNTG